MIGLVSPAGPTLEYLPMSTAAYDDLHLYTLEKTDDPERLARRQMFLGWLLEASPETREKLVGEGRLEGRLEEARTSLRHMLALRRLAPSAEDDARIDACTDLDILRRWHDQAVVAASAVEALR
jgi:hypothetical protein